MLPVVAEAAKQLDVADVVGTAIGQGHPVVTVELIAKRAVTVRASAALLEI